MAEWLGKKEVIRWESDKALICCVKSSGNQSERGLHEAARISADEYLEVNDIVQKDINVDGCFPG